MNLKILIAQQKGSYQNMFKTSLVNHRHSFQHSFLIKKLPKLLGFCFGFFWENKWGAKPLFFENPEEQGAAWAELNPEQMAAHCCNNSVRVTPTNLSFLQDNTPPGTGVRNHPWAPSSNQRTCPNSYLRDHDGSGQQSWGHPPTRISRAPCGRAAGPGATRWARRPWGSGWSCSGWDPPPWPGTGWGQTLGPATRSASI